MRQLVANVFSAGNDVAEIHELAHIVADDFFGDVKLCGELAELHADGNAAVDIAEHQSEKAQVKFLRIRIDYDCFQAHFSAPLPPIGAGADRRQGSGEMCLKAIVIDTNAQELHLRLLALMFGNIDRRVPVRVKFGELAAQLHVSEEVVRYNVRKLVDLGYIVSRGKDVGYELTQKVVFMESA